MSVICPHVDGSCTDNKPTTPHEPHQTKLRMNDVRFWFVFLSCSAVWTSWSLCTIINMLHYFLSHAIEFNFNMVSALLTRPVLYISYCTYQYKIFFLSFCSIAVYLDVFVKKKSSVQNKYTTRGTTCLLDFWLEFIFSSSLNLRDSVDAIATELWVFTRFHWCISIQNK